MPDVLLYALIAAAVTVAGGLLPVLRRSLDTRLLTALAAGLMLSVAFIEILPEGVSLGASGLGMAAGFMLMYVLEQWSPVHPCVEEGCELHHVGVLGLASLCLHSSIDGVAIAAGFALDLQLGMLVLASVAVHKFPEGLATASLALAAGWGRRRSMAATAVVASATVAGALVVVLAFPQVTASMLGLALTFAAGTFIYVAASDLLPQVHKYRDTKVALTFLGGFLFIITAHLLVG